MKTLLIAAGTGANKIVSNYIGDKFENRMDFILVDSLESDVWKYELSIERIVEILAIGQSVILLATLGGETGNRSVERISRLLHTCEIPFSALLVIPFKFERESREQALKIAGAMGKSAQDVRVFDNETLTTLDLSLKESMLYADKRIGELLEEMCSPSPLP